MSSVNVDEGEHFLLNEEQRNELVKLYIDGQEAIRKLRQLQAFYSQVGEETIWLDSDGDEADDPLDEYRTDLESAIDKAQEELGYARNWMIGSEFDRRYEIFNR